MSQNGNLKGLSVYEGINKRGGDIMKKQIIKTRQMILLLLSFLMIFGSPLASNAAVNHDNEISPFYAGVSSHSAKLSISGIKATCTATLVAEKSMKLKIKMELQKKKSDGYETVKTWSAEKTGSVLSMSESRNINILCHYRLKATFTAGSETEVAYSYE